MLIACIADGGYWRHTGAMVHSLLTHNARHRPELLVLHGQASPLQERERLRDVARAFGVTPRYMEVPFERVEPLPDRYFHRSVWFRALLPELLPGVDKVLYLDSDIVVLDSLAGLWATDVSAHAFGAVPNPLHAALQWYPHRTLGLPLEEYLNSGVLLLNLPRLRADDAFARLTRYAREHPANTCPDQDALSAVFRGAWRRLHPRWNLQTPLFDLAPEQTPFSPSELAEALAAPALVHFSGPFKPWQYLCRYPYRNRYFEHARATPWPILPLEGRTPLNRVLRRLPPDWIYRYYLLVEYTARPALARGIERWRVLRSRASR